MRNKCILHITNIFLKLISLIMPARYLISVVNLQSIFLKPTENFFFARLIFKIEKQLSQNEMIMICKHFLQNVWHKQLDEHTWFLQWCEEKNILYKCVTHFENTLTLTRKSINVNLEEFSYWRLPQNQKRFHFVY